MGWYEDMMRQSFWGSYQDAADRRRRLPTPEEVAANDRDSYYNYRGPVSGDGYDQALNAQQTQAVAGGVIAGLNGATTLLSNAYKDSQIRDTSRQEGVISDLRDAGSYGYQNYDQLAGDYARTNFSPSFGYQEIRGMTEGQQAGSVATSTLSGAMTGLQIGGPWGALIGGVVGLGTGLGGVFYGNRDAKNRLRALNADAASAANDARMNFSSAHERIGDNIHRQNAVNAVARGGRIQTVKEYADKVLGTGPRQRSYRCGGSIQKTYCDGGLKIKIKR